MTQLSIAQRNARLDVIETTLGPSPIGRVRTGAMPANADTADTGTVLATINLPADWMTAAANGQKGMSGTWSDNQADAGGMAGFVRFYRSNGTTCDMQGLVSQVWKPSTAYVVGQQVNNNGNVYRCTTAGTSAASGGPTTTGAGITDGSAVWTYLGVAFLVVDNTQFAQGQQFNITDFTLTEANA